ncbi:hypothetical protein VKT23_006712 [Stygiomarasmius scandens]|uniref:Uncharacterized protein n=1 Tax=Marasmiellus scandens TaxID=2682957 RepID=A0ABR1JLF1_9AGAR
MAEEDTFAMDVDSIGIGPESTLLPDPTTPDIVPEEPVMEEPVKVTASGRTSRLPRRYQDFLPETAPIIETDGAPRGIRRVILIVRDRLKTLVNAFGLFRVYPHRPSYDPDSAVLLEDLQNQRLNQTSVISDQPSSGEPDTTPSRQTAPFPFRNMLTFNLMHWMNTGSTQKSEREVNRLVEDVIRPFIDEARSPSFQPDDLKNFNAHTENQRANRAAEAELEAGDPPFAAGMKKSSVTIKVPSGSKSVPPAEFVVDGLLHANLISTIRLAFSEPLAKKFHLSPFEYYHQRPGSEHPTRVHGELYTSPAFIREHDQVQRAPLPLDDLDCKRERVVAGIRVWSDSTHLTNFGVAKLWPVYIMFGNLLKYICALPNSGACHHLAYIPSLPDNFGDFASGFHSKWRTQKSDILTHCRRELMHQVWQLLLDDEFVHAYQFGIVIKCADGIERRIYPRIFTYSADYPEKVLLATMRDKGLCPCPRCMIPKSSLDRMGLVEDLRYRLDNVQKYLKRSVEKARRLIFQLGAPIRGKKVEDFLKSTSSVPTLNAFVERLGHLDFDPCQMLAVDLLHEFELGVWKAFFTHLIRLLYAQGPAGAQKVQELDQRFRQVPAFGHSTIRHFATNASEMKKLAARDFEDLLQCAIPVCAGLLLDEADNHRLFVVLFRLAHWHGLAKLRLHTDLTLKELEVATEELGQAMREFRDETCSKFETVELPREQEARTRRERQVDSHTQGKVSKRSNQRKRRTLNLFTYKWHALGDYVQTIKTFGTTDNYSTQTGELAHRIVKRYYGVSNKRNAERQIANRYSRVRLLENAKQASKRENVKAKAALKPLESQVHSHLVGFAGSTHLDDLRVPLNIHHFISKDRNHHVSFHQWLCQQPEDPAKKHFKRKLRTHLLGRLQRREFDGDTHDDFNDDELEQVAIVQNQFFSVKTFRINYTTYDVRRDQDVINPRTDHCTVMVRSPETALNAHPFWYARVLGVFHADVVYFDTREGKPKSSQQRMEFLWVRWFGDEPDYQPSFREAKLPKIGFVPETDPYAFGFLDPSLVIRACHLIPDFQGGRTSSLLGTRVATAACHPGEVDDWANYYVNIFVDRDMLMRYSGGGIGHVEGTYGTLDSGGNSDSAPLLDQDDDDEDILYNRDAEADGNMDEEEPPPDNEENEELEDDVDYYDHHNDYEADSGSDGDEGNADPDDGENGEYEDTGYASM